MVSHLPIYSIWLLYALCCMLRCVELHVVTWNVLPPLKGYGKFCLWSGVSMESSQGSLLKEGLWGPLFVEGPPPALPPLTVHPGSPYPPLLLSFLSFSPSHCLTLTLKEAFLQALNGEPALASFFFKEKEHFIVNLFKANRLKFIC